MGFIKMQSLNIKHKYFGSKINLRMRKKNCYVMCDIKSLLVASIYFYNMYCNLPLLHRSISISKTNKIISILSISTKFLIRFFYRPQKSPPVGLIPSEVNPIHIFISTLKSVLILSFCLYLIFTIVLPRFPNIITQKI
jgi:hypothetical protein